MYLLERQIQEIYRASTLARVAQPSPPSYASQHCPESINWSRILENHIHPKQAIEWMKSNRRSIRFDESFPPLVKNQKDTCSIGPRSRSATFSRDIPRIFPKNTGGTQVSRRCVACFGEVGPYELVGLRTRPHRRTGRIVLWKNKKRGRWWRVSTFDHQATSEITTQPYLQNLIFDVRPPSSWFGLKFRDVLSRIVSSLLEHVNFYLIIVPPYFYT